MAGKTPEPQTQKSPLRCSWLQVPHLPACMDWHDCLIQPAVNPSMSSWTITVTNCTNYLKSQVILFIRERITISVRLPPLLSGSGAARYFPDSYSACGKSKPVLSKFVNKLVWDWFWSQLRTSIGSFAGRHTLKQRSKNILLSKNSDKSMEEMQFFFLFMFFKGLHWL